MRPPGQTSRKGAGLGANKRRAGPGGWRRAPLARAHHPPSGGPMSGAVVRSSARGTWRASGAYPQCPNHPGRWGEPADTIRKAPGGPSQQHRTQILAVETSCRSGLAASFFYLDFDVAPLSLRLAKTDSLPQELLRRRPSKNRKTFGLGRNGCGVVAPALPTDF
jgi:hypothetical protein